MIHRAMYSMDNTSIPVLKIIWAAITYFVNKLHLNYCHHPYKVKSTGTIPMNFKIYFYKEFVHEVLCKISPYFLLLIKINQWEKVFIKVLKELCAKFLSKTS